MIIKIYITIITFILISNHAMAQRLIDVHQDTEFDSFAVVEWSPDGTRLLLANGDQAKVVDAQTFETISSFQGHAELEDFTDTFQFNERFILSGAFSEDGKQVITGGYRHVAFIWDAETGEELKKIEFPIDFQQPPQFSAFNVVKLFDNKVFTQSRISGANITDLSTIQHTKVERSELTNIVFLTKRGIMIASGSVGTHIFSLENGELIDTLSGGDNLVLEDKNLIKTILNVSLDGSLNFGFVIKDYSIDSMSLINESEKLIINNPKQLSLTPEGNQIISLARDETTISFHDITSGMKNANIEVVSLNKIKLLNFSTDGKKFVATGSDNKIAIYDVSDLTSGIPGAINLDN